MSVRSLLNIQKQLLPDLSEVLKKRYTILHSISVSGLIGRRTLASSLNLSERVLRAEVDFLKGQGLIRTDSHGMRITSSGKQLLVELEPMVKELFGLNDMEDKIRTHYGLKQVIIVPGDADQSLYTKKELGRAGAIALRKTAANGDVIAVTGGSTMAETANALTASTNFKDCTFVPARGGLGEMVELQANSIASTMAKQTGSTYRLLHVPDHLSEETYLSLSQEPNVKELVQMIRRADIVIHGIGEALVMAHRRKMELEKVEQLKESGALAEAFGYYFDSEGNALQKVPTIGLRLEDLKRCEWVIAVAGGESKGEAIAAIMRYGHNHILVTDEAAALKMISYENEL